MKKIFVISFLVVVAAGSAFWIGDRNFDISKPRPHEKPSISSAALPESIQAPDYRNIEDLSLPELETEIAKVKEVIDRDKLVDVMNDPNGDENSKMEAKRIIQYRLDLAIRKIDLHLSYLETQFAKGQ